MTDRPASWRMPTPNQMEKLAAEAVRRPAVPAAAPNEALPPHIGTRCLETLAPARPAPRCGNDVFRRSSACAARLLPALERTVEIQIVDAVRPYAGRRSGRRSRSGSSTIRASNAQDDTKRTGAGRVSRSSARQKSAAGAIARAIGGPISLGHGNPLQSGNFHGQARR
jgi:hypothetical protein